MLATIRIFSTRDQLTPPPFTQLEVNETRYAYHQLRLKLPGVPKEQNSWTPPIQPFLTTGTPIHSLAICGHGFHHRAA